MAAHLHVLFWAEMGCTFVEKAQDSFKKEELLLFLRGRQVVLHVVFLPFLLDESLGRIIFCSDALACPYLPVRDAFPHPPSSSGSVGTGSVATPGVKRLYPAVRVLKASSDL